ncbi:duf1275 domain-containing protein [Coniella lustricola]|uniref:Duf1275 domain-containing protein n=1 Tax=Coniella lustricola TaxID=2025994 RepID=A0A2T2ZUI8_9PEZI|nr:duf1275 domain-containing protein [Coniella lustricola]
MGITTAAATAGRASLSDAPTARAPPPPPPPGFLSTLRDEVDMAHTDVPVIACCFVSGLCDSVAFNASSVFVSMQTGNTIFLALGTAHLPYGSSTLWLKALVSIAAFWLGCFAFGQTRRIGNKRKGTLALSFLVQAVLILVSAAVAQSRAVPAFALASLGSEATEAALRTFETNAMSLLPLSLMAFQFGGQIVTSRVLGLNEVPTNVLTSLYCDLLSDPLLFAPARANIKRNRRVVAIVLMVVGAILGAWCQKSRAGMPTALWIAGAVKMCIAAAWLTWKTKAQPVDEKGSKV